MLKALDKLFASPGSAVTVMQTGSKHLAHLHRKMKDKVHCIGIVQVEHREDFVPKYDVWRRAGDPSRRLEKAPGIGATDRDAVGQALYLERWSFTPQEPMKKAYEQSPAAVKKWHLGNSKPTMFGHRQQRQRRRSSNQGDPTAERGT